MALLPAGWDRPLNESSASDVAAPAIQLKQFQPNEVYDDAIVAALREAVTSADPAFVEARRLAELPRGRFVYDETEDYSTSVLPRIHMARTVAFPVECQALLQAHDGDGANAALSNHTLLNLSRSVGDEPSILAQLI